jgi:hypothetical protein
MTKAELIEQMKQYPDDTELYAFNGDEGQIVPVTGLLFDPSEHGQPPTLEFCTDEP